MSFQSQPMSTKELYKSDLLLPPNMRKGDLSKLDQDQTVSAEPEKMNKFKKSNCYTDPLSWMCYKQDGKCICPMRGDKPN